MSESSLVGIYQEGLQLQVGNGTKTKFWHDLWVQEGRLKEVFPSLYRVTLNTECSISECGIWDGYIWRWSLQWRRDLWEWEEQDLVKFLVILSKIGIRQEKVDTLKWKHDKQGNFSVKSFLDVVYKNKEIGVEPNMYNFTKQLWKSIVPPRVELLMWFVILERLNTRDRLCKFKIVPEAESCCVLCKDRLETVHHLFFSCDHIWKLWGSILEDWSVIWVWPGTTKECFEVWMDRKIRKDMKEVWMVLFFSVIWCTWKCRNNIVFNNGVLVLEKLKEEVVECTNRWCQDRQFRSI
ncbi:hypothetical protein AHAS_Ahas19G0130100 [Arachis hypogaea]